MKRDIQTNIRMTAEARDKIKTLASLTGLSMAGAVVLAIYEAVAARQTGSSPK